MQIIPLELSHDQLFCPVSGRQILYTDDVDETVPSFKGYALWEFPEEAKFNDEVLKAAWEEFKNNIKGQIEHKHLEVFLKNYKDSTTIVFEITTSGIACGPVAETVYFVIDMDARPAEDIRAEELEKETNYAIRFYDDEGEELETIDGLGGVGSTWLPTPSSPDMAALLMIDIEKIKPYLVKHNIQFQKAGRINHWEVGNEEYAIEDGVLIHEQTKEKSKAIAKEFGLEFIYFFDWDGVRLITIEDVASEVSIRFGRGKE